MPTCTCDGWIRSPGEVFPSTCMNCGGHIPLLQCDDCGELTDCRFIDDYQMNLCVNCLQRYSEISEIAWTGVVPDEV